MDSNISAPSDTIYKKKVGVAGSYEFAKKQIAKKVGASELL